MKASAPVEPPPRLISHYTNLEGLKGLIESGHFWASNASFLNDRAELSHALKTANLAISKLSSQTTMKAWAPLLKKVIAEFQSDGVPDTYVVCFCRSGDNLSQWRGYGGTVQGVSITFDRVKLTKRLRNDAAEFLKVKYTRLSTADRLSEALTSEIRDIAELDEFLGEADEDSRRNDLRNRVARLLPRFKDLGFSDEKEWRYAIQRKVEAAHLCFRISNNKIIPYIKVGASDDRFPITAARVGPGPDQELTMRSVQLFLHSKGYDIPVSMSEVPFRP